MEIHGFLQIVKVVLSQKFFTSLSVCFLKCGNSYLYLGHTILHAIVSHFHTEEPFSNETFDLHNVIKFLLQESSELYCTLFNNAYPKSEHEIVYERVNSRKFYKRCVWIWNCGCHGGIAKQCHGRGPEAPGHRLFWEWQSPGTTPMRCWVVLMVGWLF